MGSAAPRPIVYLLFWLTGTTGLVYELVWTRELIFVFGGTTYAITTVLVAFMAGLGLGSYLAGRISARLAQPGRIYGLLEMTVGAYALIVPTLLHLAEPLYRALYPHVADMPWLLTVVRFAIGCLIMLFPTTCMGATLPILVRYITLQGYQFGRSISLLYGINTLGAVIGTAAAGFIAIPAIGLTLTTWSAAAINLIVGAIAASILRVERREAALEPGAAAATGAPPATGPIAGDVLTRSARAAVLIAFAASGFAAMVYQIAWTRALIMSLGSSTYSFTCILAAFILGLALGSLAVARFIDRWRSALLVFGALEVLIGVASVLVVPAFGWAPVFVGQLVARFGASYNLLVASQFALVIAVTLVPTLLLGAIFPLVTRSLAAGTHDAGAATGRAYAVNTIGTILGSCLTGFVLIRSNVLGIQNSIVFAALLNALVGVWLVWMARVESATRRRALRGLAVAGVAIIPAFALAAGRWDEFIMTSGPFLARQDVREAARDREMLFYAEGVDCTVTVWRQQSDPDALTMTVNGKPDASTALLDMPNMLLVAHLGALLDRNGQEACVVGLGSGLTVAAVARHPGYRRIDYVEISDEVIAGAQCFAPYCYDVLTADPRVAMIRADGRNHLLLTDRTYDLLISEPSNPWITGVSNLFTHEYFRLCERCLRPDGVLCVWLNGYSVSLEDFRLVARTLQDVFPFVAVGEMLADDYIFVAGRRSFRAPLDEVQRRFDVPAVREDLYRVGISGVAHVLGRFIASGATLRQWAGGGMLNTDDNARLEFSAPHTVLRNQSYEIARSLADIQHSPFRDLVFAVPTNERHRSIQDGVATVMEARRLRLAALEAWNREEPLRALETLADARSLDPTSLRLYWEATDVPRKLPAMALDIPQVRAVLDRLARIREPTIASRRGQSLDEIAGLVLSAAGQATAVGNWAAAADYLAEAQQLVPDSTEVALQRAAALAQAGQTRAAIAVLDDLLRRAADHGMANYLRATLAVTVNDQDGAIAHLQVALRSGAVTPEMLADDEILAPLRRDPRFMKLLENR